MRYNEICDEYVDSAKSNMDVYTVNIPDEIPERWMPYTILQALDGKTVNVARIENEEAVIILQGLPVNIPSTWLTKS